MVIISRETQRLDGVPFEVLMVNDDTGKPPVRVQVDHALMHLAADPEQLVANEADMALHRERLK